MLLSGGDLMDFESNEIYRYLDVCRIYNKSSVKKCSSKIFCERNDSLWAVCSIHLWFSEVYTRNSQILKLFMNSKLQAMNILAIHGLLRECD